MNPKTNEWYELPIPDPIATVTPWEFRRLELLGIKRDAEYEIQLLEKIDDEILQTEKVSLDLKFSLYQDHSRKSRMFEVAGYFKINNVLYLVSDFGGIICPEKYIKGLKNYVNYGSTFDGIVDGSNPVWNYGR